jgi:hypothetical protein
VGEGYLPQPGTLARVVEAETAEGLFRFGRPLENEEVVKYSAQFIERHLTGALDELSKLLVGAGDEPNEELPTEKPALLTSSKQ